MTSKRTTTTRKTTSSPKAAASAARKERTAAPLTISRSELLVNGSDSMFRQLVHNLFAFSTRHEAMRAGHGQRIGLSGIEYTFLISIRHLEVNGVVGVKQLADHLHLSGPFTTTMVGKLMAKGLVDKEPSPDDGRRVCLKVTEAGFGLLRELAPTQRQVNDLQFGCLSHEEFLQLSNLMGRLIDSADKALALQAYLNEHSTEGN
ncbi:MAG: winged helix-turn-helix transcriptional regulator [Gammaproteobacteria bacterium]|jgi:DNA-binding MarR family transcriptional regulator|nr:winged helix-turn-helix transcriptional regulator [Gammaproteobacteria bacterium]|tara:strand:- start:3040 stop:3651 length:612 start_codon:yes stop_codon:yes gene_type:complete